jgi:hypothetical protein
MKTVRAFDIPKEEAEIGALHEQIVNVLDFMEDKHDDLETMHIDQIQIIVNKQVFTFIFGGPQVEALFKFMTNICDENGYDLPWKKEQDL